MESLRKWLTTLAFLMLGLAALIAVTRPQPSHAVEASTQFKECVFVETFINKWLDQYRVTIKDFVEGEPSPVKPFALKGWTPVSGTAPGVLLCR